MGRTAVMPLSQDFIEGSLEEVGRAPGRLIFLLYQSISPFYSTVDWTVIW